GASAISLEDLPDVMNKLRSNPGLIANDTVDVFDFMLASGWRVGEVCALDVSSVDFAAGTAEVEATNVRVSGQGIVRQSVPKTDASARVTPLPAATMEMLRCRHEQLQQVTTLLFP